MGSDHWLTHEQGGVPPEHTPGVVVPQPPPIVQAVPGPLHVPVLHTPSWQVCVLQGSLSVWQT
jgi:hypothetical protein